MSREPCDEEGVVSILCGRTDRQLQNPNSLKQGSRFVNLSTAVKLIYCYSSASLSYKVLLQIFHLIELSHEWIN